MGIKNYTGYILNEQEINLKDSLMFFSPKFISLIKKINSPITKDLMDLLDNRESRFPFSYINLNDDIDFISVMPANRIGRIEGITQKDLENPDPNSPVWNEKGRQVMRIGAFVTRLFPKYAGTKDLENFVQQIKGIRDAENYTIRLVRGEELRAWYHVKTYYNPHPGMEDPPEDEGVMDIRTPLMKSCLKQPEKQHFFDMYVENPDKVGLLIMTNTDNKLVCRALVWFDVYMVDNPQNPTKGTIMDRIYYTQESDVHIFINYAKEHGWWYKTNQAKGCETYVVNGQVMDKPLRTQLPHHRMFAKFPYMDTFCYYSPDTGRLASTRGKPAKNMTGKTIGECPAGNFFDRYLLQKANGGFKKLLPK